MKRLALALAGMAAVSIAIFPAQAAVPDRYAFRGGIVRLGSAPELHDDAGHAPLGITRVYVTADCDLRIVLRDQPGDRIITQEAEEDSALLALGIEAGIDGGATSATVSLWRDGEHVCADDPIFADAHADVRLAFHVWGAP